VRAHTRGVAALPYELLKSSARIWACLGFFAVDRSAAEMQQNEGVVSAGPSVSVATTAPHRRSRRKLHPACHSARPTSGGRYSNQTAAPVGLVYAGVGWVIWREPEDLPQDLVFHVRIPWVGCFQVSTQHFALIVCHERARTWSAHGKATA
jgi:hypothetical protein